MRLLISVSLIIGSVFMSRPASAQMDVEQWQNNYIAQCSTNDALAQALPPDLTTTQVCTCVAQRIAGGHNMRWVENQPTDDPVYMQAKVESCGVHLDF